MSTSIEIDFAGPAEIPRLLPLFLELESYYFGAEAASGPEIETYLRERVFGSDSSVRMLVASFDGEIVGLATFAILYPAPRLSGQAYLKDLFTSARVRGQGVGKALMIFLARHVLSLGCQRLDWTAERSNPSAGAFYYHLGATEVSEKQYFRFEGAALEAFALQK